MKKEYNIKDKVWIHIGERTLTEGRVVEIITLDHLKENHLPGHELYIVEIKTGIDDVYEVRDFDQISPDAQGPINLCRHHKEKVSQAKRMLKKIGITLPDGTMDPVLYNDNFDSDGHDGMGSIDDPTPEQIHAALERAEREKHQPLNLNPRPAGKRPSKKRTFTKRKKNDSINS
jgi:hypothetical protein